MFDILSTAELTVSASIAVAFLSWAMARTEGGRIAVLIALGAWFVLVLAIGATGALSPAGGAPGARPRGRFARRGARFGVFRPTLCANAMTTTPLPALIAVQRSVCSGCFSCSTPRAAFPRRLRPARGGVMSSSASTALPLAWAVTRFGPRHAAARVLMERGRRRRPCRCCHAGGPVGAGSTPGFRWTARPVRQDDQFALAHHSGLSGPNPVFHSHRYFHGAPDTRLRAAYAWRGAQGQPKSA